MSPEQWQKIHELFEAALERPAEDRAAFLERACAGAEETRRRVEAMLEADAQNDLLVDRPAYQAADIFATLNSRPDDSQSYSGETIGVYRLIKELGRGGMGTVYLAYDTRLGRQAALKLLPSHLVNNPERVRRFQREARTASALNHPNIITIYDFGQEDGRHYIVSEFVEGRTLRNFVGGRDVSLNQILDLVAQVASALEAAHAAGIVHRDIKPENIMLRPDGYAKVLDFGLAKLTEPESGGDEAKTDVSWPPPDFETRTGIVLGTVNYMSPEQARGQKVDGRSDLFSLAVVLYELIPGRRPFGGETWHHTIVAITDAEPPPIARNAQGAPAALQEIIDRALAKDRERRYQTARALLADAQTLRGELAADARIQLIRTERAQDATKIEEQITRGETQAALTNDESVRDKVIGAVLSLARFKRRRLIAAVVILAAVAAYCLFGLGVGPGRPALTDKDTILRADFVNTTGDAVFDGTLKQGLVVQLEQSPYLNIFPEERARETLRLMERSRDEKITRELGREICQRRGIKALLVGTIASLGRNYVITLEAVNSQSGEAIASQQVEAEGKEQVLRALGRASTAMHKKLGESLVSILKFDAPIEHATTASLEAFKDYTVGVELWRKEQFAQSVQALNRAIERDSEFALAYSRLGVSYRELRNLALGNQYLERAYQLRNRVSERERLAISAT